MHFEDEEQDFWSDEPTRPLRRVVGSDPVRGSRSHTGAVPLVPVAEGKWRPSRASIGTGRVDPFWARIGMVVGAFALLVPVALIVRATGSAAPAKSAEVATPTSADPTSSSSQSSSSASGTADPGVAQSTAATSPDSAAATDASVAMTAAAPVATPSSTRSSGGIGVGGAAAAPPTIPITVTCDNTYKVVAGDYWLGIASKTGAKIKELLAANDATAKTVLYPGRTVCLPAGASPPTTAAPTTAAKPAASTASTAAASTAASTTSKPAPTTAAPTTAAPTTAAPTTAAPTTTAPKTYTRDQIIQIIRDVWPDDQEDKAIAIATRESNLNPTVRNYCCFGLFQIYYTMHTSWLSAMGITSAEMLYDPLLNTKAAYALYLRSGGWGPWGG